MAKLPKCKECGKDITDKTQAIKKGSYWYHNNCINVYKPQENTPRRKFTDAVQDYYLDYGYSKNEIMWNTIQAQANKLMKENKQYTYQSMAYVLWYAREIEKVPISDEKGVIGIIEWCFDRARKYCKENIELKKSIASFNFDEIETVKINKTNKINRKYQNISFD